MTIDKYLASLASREENLLKSLEAGNREALWARIAELENERDELRRQLRHLMASAHTVVVHCVTDGLFPAGLSELHAEWDALMQQEYPSCP